MWANYTSIWSLHVMLYFVVMAKHMYGSEGYNKYDTEIYATCSINKIHILFMN